MSSKLPKTIPCAAWRYGMDRFAPQDGSDRPAAE